MRMPTLELYTLSLHDALPICCWCREHADEENDKAKRKKWHGPSGLVCPRETFRPWRATQPFRPHLPTASARGWARARSEEHTSELQSHSDLVCRLLLEKKKKT